MHAGFDHLAFCTKDYNHEDGTFYSRELMEAGNIKGSVRPRRALLRVAANIMVATTVMGMTLGFVPCGSSSTLISGQIVESTVWTPFSSPYIITGEVNVMNQAILTVNPGVVVRFAGNFSITVLGTLQSIGEVDDPVIFASDQAHPKAGDWNTIRFVGAQNESLIVRNTVIEHARNGITVQSTGKTLVEGSKIFNSLVNGILINDSSNVTVRDSNIEFNGNGVAAFGERVSGIKIVRNVLRFNDNGMHFQASADQGAAISNIVISGNTVASNRNGIFFYIFAGSAQYLDASLISGIVIENNTVASNAEYGIHLYSGGPWLGIICDSAILGNKISSNKVGICLFAKLHSIATEFDVIISKNDVTGNSDEGIFVHGGELRPTEEGIRTNITGNLVCYNGLGISYYGDTSNIAFINDIYNNTFGMSVVSGASVNAENNFWGDAGGPYHPTLNALGKGNRVNGNGVDLDFEPFLSAPIVNERPVAQLDANTVMVAVAEAVALNGSRSSDDGWLKQYFFDFGDGTDSGWITYPVVWHDYDQVGAYEVNLRVLDDLGFESSNTAVLTIHVQPTLNVAVSFSSSLAYSDDDLVVTIHITDGANPVPEANVKVNSSHSGAFVPHDGRTNSEGDFTTNYRVPSVETQTFIFIEANASKNGYWSAEGRSQIEVLPKRTTLPIELTAIGITIASILFLAALLLLRKRSQRRNTNGATKKMTGIHAQVGPSESCLNTGQADAVDLGSENKSSL